MSKTLSAHEAQALLAQSQREKEEREAAEQAAETVKKRSLQERADAGEQLTVDDLALLTNRVVRRKSFLTSVGGKQRHLNQFAADHNAAAALHGWDAHRHHANKPMELTLVDYTAAIKAAEAPVQRRCPTRGCVTRLEPHQPARSGHCPHAELEQLPPFTD